MKQKLETFSKGSVLVYSLIILFVMLSIVLAMSAVSINERNNAGTTGKSVQAFQTANTGSELFAKALKAGPANIAAISDGTILKCGADGKITGGSTATGGIYTIELYDAATPTPALIDCHNTTDPLSNVAKIKSVGTYGGSSRAIEVAMAAGGSGGITGGCDVQQPGAGWIVSTQWGNGCKSGNPAVGADCRGASDTGYKCGNVSVHGSPADWIGCLCVAN